MAYYPTFQPYGYQDQLNQLRTANPISNPMPYTMPMQRPDPSGLNWVQGEAGAKSWIVTPGATVLLMDSEAQRFYLKTADQSGVPNMRTFEYSEIGVKPQEAAQAASFVTVDVFNDFKAEVMGKLDELSATTGEPTSRKKKGEANE